MIELGPGIAVVGIEVRKPGGQQYRSVWRIDAEKGISVRLRAG